MDVERGLNQHSHARTSSDVGASDPVPAAGQSHLESRSGASQLVLTPARLRLNSWAMAVYATSQWGMNSAFCALLMCQLTQQIQLNWWLVFLPLWLGHAMHLPAQLTLIALTGRLVQQQLGPPPGQGAPHTITLQYAVMKRVRSQSHVMDHAASLVDGAACLVVQVLLCWQTQAGALAPPLVCWRVAFTPLWVSWAVCTVLGLARAPSERQWVHPRDLVAITSVFVALKLDGVAAMSWRLVFLVPWLWFATLIVVAGMLVVLLATSGTWQQPEEQVLPLGLLALVLAALGQLPSWIALAQRLDGGSASVQDILLPASISWGVMWAAGLLLAAGVAHKEALRLRLAAQGAVWTRIASVAGRREGTALAQTAVDAMSDQQVAALAAQQMEGADKPEQLVRLGSSLYRRLLPLTAPLLPMGSAAIPQPPKIGAAGAVGMCTGWQSGVTALQGKGTPDSACPEAALAVGAAVGEGQCEDAGEEGCVFVEVRLLPATARSQAQASPFAQQAAVPAAQQAGALPAGAQAPAAGMLSSGSCCSSSSSMAGSSSGSLAASGSGSGSGSLAGSSSVDAALTINASGCQQLSRACSTGSEDGACSICFSAPGTCILLECGHGGYCRPCANRMFVRPPQQCPHCRAPIGMIVELAAAAQEGDVGAVVPVC